MGVAYSCMWAEGLELQVAQVEAASLRGMNFLEGTGVRGWSCMLNGYKGGMELHTVGCVGDFPLLPEVCMVRV